MTKPSYEERELGDARIALDAEYDAALKEFNSRPLHVGLFLTRRQWFEARVLELHVDLARVRGLLQRATGLLRMTVKASGFFDEEVEQRIKEFLEESADIGKLDAADKSGVEMGKVNVWVEREFLSKVLFYLDPEDTPNDVIFKLQELGGGIGEPVAENACQECGRDNPTWFADNEVWNSVIPDRVGFLCPICFIARAEAVDFKCTGWKLVPEKAGSAETGGEKADEEVS